MYIKTLFIIKLILFLITNIINAQNFNADFDFNGNILILNKNHTKRPTIKELCNFCEITIPILRTLIKQNRTENFYNIASYICVQLKIEDATVCDLAIKSYQTSILSVAKDTELSSIELCSLAFGCTVINNPIYKWNVTLTNITKPDVTPNALPKKGAPTIRVLQLSDIPIDFEYQPGSLADCGEPLCCRNITNVKNEDIDEDKAAGYWGDYRNCDIPLWTVENMFEHIAKNEKFDFIYWTGDLPPHNIWNQTRKDQIRALEILTSLFLKYFPDKAIYPTLGNHEAQPCNLFPTPSVKEDNINWLYSSLAREWTKTGLPSYLSANISNGAFYTLKILPNLRLVSINKNYCPKENFWLIINSTDPLGQLEWLVNVLQESENNNEKVHIIGHIHPSNCLESWSSNYYKIINRYESTITVQIFGHSHRDEFKIFYDLNNITRPVSMSYLGPSVTTTSFLNPGYRIYTLDGPYEDASRQIIDHETYFLNITEANLYKAAKWKKEYSAKEAYNLESLFPEDWDFLVDKLSNNLNSPYLKDLLRFFSKSSDMFPECDKICKKKLLCSFKQARSDKFIPCS